MKKKIALFLSVMTLCVSSLSVYAAEADIMPQALACGRCEGGRLFEKKEYRTSVEISGCIHGREGWKDTYYWQGHYFILECSSCHAVSDELISRELIKLTCGPNG